MKRGLSLLAALVLLTAAAACGRGGTEKPAAPAGAPAAPAAQTAQSQTGAPTPLASSQAQAPPTADAAAAAEIRKEIAGFTLTEPTLDKIIAIEKDLGDFWADPVQAGKIRGQRSLPKILAAIDAAPRVKSTIAAHGLTPREYILGSFSMIGGYVWERAKAQQPQAIAGQMPPVNGATLATVQKRIPDITKLLSPPPGRTKPPSKSKPKGHPEEE